jgi:PAS domain S-box-containing protein
MKAVELSTSGAAAPFAQEAHRAALKLSLSYALMGFVWILVSDHLLELWSGSHDFVAQGQTLKGWIFVSGSAALIYFMVHAALRRTGAAEEASRTNEWRFAQVAEKAPGGIFLTDSTGDCIFANNHWKTLTGLAESEPLGSGWQAAVHPDFALRRSRAGIRPCEQRSRGNTNSASRGQTARARGCGRVRPQSAGRTGLSSATWWFVRM